MWYVHKNSNITLNTDVLARSSKSSRHGIEVGCGVKTENLVHEHRSLSLVIFFSPKEIFLNGTK